MGNYQFQYLQGSSRPSSTVVAKDDFEAYKLIKAFIDESPDRTFLPGTIRMREYREVPDPAWAKGRHVPKIVNSGPPVDTEPVTRSDGWRNGPHAHDPLGR